MKKYLVSLRFIGDEIIFMKKYICCLLLSINLCSCSISQTTLLKFDNIKKNNTMKFSSIEIPSLDIKSINNLKHIVLKDKIVISKSSNLDSAFLKEELQNLNEKKFIDEKENIIKKWSNPIVTWNQIARDLVIKNRFSPPDASRVYALLSVAQYETLLTLFENKHLYKISSDDNSIQSFPSEISSIAQVSYNILLYLFPKDKDFLDKNISENKLVNIWSNNSSKIDFRAVEEISELVSKKIIEIGKNDNSNNAMNEVNQINEEGSWRSNKNPLKSGLLPSWGNVKPWIIDSIKDLEVNPPPKYKSQEFNDALDEVIKVTKNLTSEQYKIALFWSDELGTFTPPGHWNLIASDLIKENNLNNLQSSYIMSLMNMSIMNAGICCWFIKYKYQLLRPSQASKDVQNIIPLPDFPSYTSGHSSFSGAASTILSSFFPKNKEELTKLANEASMSRLYGGIHYRFDNEEGLKNGKNIAIIILNEMKK